MSSQEIDLTERLHALAEEFDMPVASPADDVRRGRGRVRRNRGRVVGAVLALVAVSLGAAAIVGPDREGSDGLDPVDRPVVLAGDVPVWWDANGLHRGDIVEQTPVKIGVLGANTDTLNGALALVRTGAVYTDPTTGDVWFHPWGADPRIVGRDSQAGPGGDPNGDTAAWFEGSDPLNGGPGELVVYDTAAGREISRSLQSHGVAYKGGDHYPPGNGFLQVSGERIIWTSGPQTYIHDLRTRGTATFKAPRGRYTADVHDDVEVFGERGSVALVVKTPRRAEERYSDLETHVRLSPSGNYVLAVEGTDTRHAAAIVDTRTGELWRVPKNAYPWIAWSYGDIALVDVEDELIACDAARRVCEALPAERPLLMPTN
jgi:hypothetical protein